MKPIFISLKNINKWRDHRHILSNINLDIYENEVVTFLGSNGAGKTTLSSVIATLHPADSGTIYWKGRLIHEDLLSYRLCVGYCPQHTSLHRTFSIEENLHAFARYFGMSNVQAKSAVWRVVNMLSLQEHLDKLPADLSGGLRQRVMIARSLIHSPNLLILDEPTVALDAHIRRNVWDIIVALKKEGVTIILTTHYLDEAEFLSDRIILMHQGKIVSVGTVAQMKHDYSTDNLEAAFMAFLKDRENGSIEIVT